MSDIPRPALRESVPYRGRALFILALIISVGFLFICITDYESADAASLGYVVPSGLSEHTNLCYVRQPVTESITPTNTELWLYWITDQNADYCNLVVDNRSEQKAEEEAQTVVAEENRLKLVHIEENLKGAGELLNIQESLVHDVGSSGIVTKKITETNEKLESLRTEVKTVANNTSSLKVELESVKAELANMKKVDESVNTSITEIGSEGKPLYVRTPSSEPASKVEVADFTSGAQSDLGEMQKNIVTVGFFVIGTIIAGMISVFLYLILRPHR